MPSCFLHISIWSMTKLDKSKSSCQVHSITYEILYGSDLLNNFFISLMFIQSYANLEIHDLCLSFIRFVTEEAISVEDNISFPHNAYFSSIIPLYACLKIKCSEDSRLSPSRICYILSHD